MSRWRSVGLSALLLSVFASASLGAVRSVTWEHQKQNYTLPVGVELPPQLLADKGHEHRIALVIGNGNYSRNGWLKNPPNDATDIARKLEQLGFEVRLKVDLNQEEMEKEIERFNRRLQQGGVGLFYYAGHAVQTGGENYLIPLGAKINREQDLRYRAVPLGHVLGAMEEAGNHLNIVILDACRDNPSLRRFTKSIARGLARIQQEPEGMLIAYATAPGDVAQDGEGRNSPYTASLLEHIVEPGIPLPLFFENVRRSVRQKTGNQQSPRYISSVDGSFFFKPAPPVPLARPAPKPTPQPSPNPPDVAVLPQPLASPPQLPSAVPRPSTSEPILISESTKIDYRKLHELLEAEHWRFADRETEKLMIEAASKDIGGRGILSIDYEHLPCEDLRIIDRLWLDASDRKFGFSVQNQIYQGLGGADEHDEDAIWLKFAEQVSWTNGGLVLNYSKLTFDLKQTRGHLPRLVFGFYNKEAKEISSRVSHCKL